MKPLLNILITLISLSVPAYIVFRAKPNMSSGNRWLIFLLAVGTSWLLIVLATELSMTLDIRYAPTSEAEQYMVMHDSGPRIGALFGGWIPATIYVLFLAGINLLIKKRKNRTSGPRVPSTRCRVP